MIVKPKRSSDGIGLRSRCSGDGSRVSVVGQHCRKTYVSWSGRWLRKTRLGGEERIASELSLKLGIQVSPRTETPVRAPKADAFCERLIGTIRRECLDCLIPLQDRQGVRDPLQSRIAHIRRWDLEFWSRPQPKFRPASIGTSFPPGTASRQRRFSVGYTMNTACKRRLLSAGPNFCGLQPDYAHARI